MAHRHKSVSTLRDWIGARRLSDKHKGWCRHSTLPTFSGYQALAHMPSSHCVAGHPLLPSEPAQVVFSGPACLPATRILSHALCTLLPMHTPITPPSPSHPNYPLSSNAKTPSWNPEAWDRLRLINICWQNAWWDEWVNSLIPVVSHQNPPPIFNLSPHWEMVEAQ